MDRIFEFIESSKATLMAKSEFLYISVKAAIAIILAFLIWLIIRKVISFIEKRRGKNKSSRASEPYLYFIRRIVFYGLILITGTYLINIFKIQLFQKVFYAFLIILLATPVKDLLIVLMKFLEGNLAAKTDTKIDDIIFEIVNKFSGAIIYAVAIILALDILGVNVMPFVAGAGVAGIAIGFAAKDTLSNLIAGVLLIIDRPFEIGDRIEIWTAPAGSATWGDVVHIGLRATKIKTTDNIVVIIPNNEIMKRDIVNYTILTSKIRVRINIGIAYDTDIQKAKDTIIEVIKSAKWISDDPPPKVVVKDFGESSVNLQARVWIDDARRRMDTISYVIDMVKEAFDKEGIEIPYPKRDITIIHKDSNQGSKDR
ncbi:mechanosensitive ion channel family protein [Thermodesulfobacteriota bacterium]